MNYSIEEVIEAAKKYIPAFNESRFRRAYDFAAKAHEGQLRKEGSPYIVHPVSAAYILTTMRADEDTLIGALLHDVPEDTTYTLPDIEKIFGKSISFLVNGITKLSKVHYKHNMEERQIESLKKLFIHSAQDIRIILIKLADRLHNMTTISAHPKPEKRTRIAKETLEIFVPIANLLGMWELKSRLEDLCFQTLMPEEYEHVENLSKESDMAHHDIIKKNIQHAKKLLTTNGVKDFVIEGRKKTFYSIYKKMVNKSRSFHEIYDLIGLRIVVADIGKCYQVLGVIHQNYTPKLGRMKDYIAIPKSNGYQSIHTTVFGVEGALTEFQIRTEEMNLECEYGVAAHYFYSNENNKQKSYKKMQQKAGWVKKILEMQRGSENKHYLDDLKLDIFQDRIFIFTPKGDVIDLPKGSTIIDFAYHIHSGVGNSAASGIVNGTKENLDTPLATGDVVEVITSKDAEPKLDWLYSVNTNNSKNKIKDFLKSRDESAQILDGERLLNEKILIYGYQGVDFLTFEQKKNLMKAIQVTDWKLALKNIGNGTCNVDDVMRELFSKIELIGEALAPDYLKAYAGNDDRIHLSIAPPKVHKVHFVVESVNRVGMLRDISNVIASLRINIIHVSTERSTEASVNIWNFEVEIRDIKQYEKVIYSLDTLPGVLNIKHVHSPNSQT